MLIDWFTVIAQAINFLLLVWLLKRFLYQPVLRAIDERRQKIRTQLLEAEAKMAEAGREKEVFEQKNRTLQEQWETRLEKIELEAREKRLELLEAVRAEVGEMRAQWETSLRAEYEELNSAVLERTQREVMAIARQTLHDLASADLESEMVRIFLERLRQLAAEPKERLVETLSAAGGEVMIRSAFELSPAQREALRDALTTIVAGEIQCQFDSAPEKISGIELTAGGYKIAWSVSEYLGMLEKHLAELLHKEEKDRGAPASKAPNEYAG